MLAFYSRADTRVRIVTEHLAPYQISQNNQLIGGTVGVKMKGFLNNVLPENEIEVLPWARAYQIASEVPNTVIFSLVRTPEREDKFIWIGKVAHVSTEIITLKDSNIQPIKTLSELKGMTIGVKRHDAITTFLASKGFEFDKDLLEIVSTLSTMQMLEKGRIDATPSNKQVIDFYCLNAGCKSSDFKTIYTVEELSEDFYLAVSLGTDEKLITELKAEFSKLDLSIQ